jgi:hypothetical protein
MLTPLDNGFFTLTVTNARLLAGGKLPKPGNEKLVKIDQKYYWLSRTMANKQQVWAVRETNWRLVNGQAVLGGIEK